MIGQTVVYVDHARVERPGIVMREVIHNVLDIAVLRDNGGFNVDLVLARAVMRDWSTDPEVSIGNTWRPVSPDARTVAGS